jgi:hypothetical protein
MKIIYLVTVRNIMGKTYIIKSSRVSIRVILQEEPVHGGVFDIGWYGSITHDHHQRNEYGPNE